MQIKIGKKNNEGDKTYLKEYIYIIRTHISHTNIHLVMKIEKKNCQGTEIKMGIHHWETWVPQCYIQVTGAS